MNEELGFVLSLADPLVEEEDGSLSDYRLVKARVLRDMPESDMLKTEKEGEEAEGAVGLEGYFTAISRHS